MEGPAPAAKNEGEREAERQPAGMAVKGERGPNRAAVRVKSMGPEVKFPQAPPWQVDGEGVTRMLPLVARP